MVYRYICSCGHHGDQWLDVDKSSVIIMCPNCHRGVAARQVRDKSVTFKEKDGVKGIMRNDTDDNN